jgi:2'-5' RNA ligase
MHEPRNKIRAFIAIELPYKIRQCLGQFQAEMKKSKIRAAWVKPETMHLTLKFLGDVKASDIGKIKSVMKKATAPVHAGFNLNISNPGIFGPFSRPKVLWIGVKDRTGSLEALASDLDSGFSEALNIKKESRKFMPHITLARVKKGSSGMQPVIKYLKTNDLKLQFHVDSIHLFESRLYHSGAVHKNIFSACF